MKRACCTQSNGSRKLAGREACYITAMLATLNTVFNRCVPDGYNAAALDSFKIRSTVGGVKPPHLFRFFLWLFTVNC